VIRQGYLINIRALIAVVVAFLIAAVVVGCGRGPGNIDARDGERGAAATNEETTALEGDRSAAETVQEPVGLDVKVVSPGQNYVPAGFGEGSLWATDLGTCNDTGSSATSTSAGSASATAGTCALPANTLLKRLDPETGEEVAEISLKGFSANITEATFGAGSVWVSSTSGEAGVVIRVDSETNRVVDRIPVPVNSPTSLAYGHGSVWIASSGHDTVSRVDPQTGEVAAKIEVGRGAVDIATDESSGDVWVASVSEDRKQLSRVDPATNRVVAEVPIAAHSRYGGAQSVAVGEGSVWVQSVDGKLFKVDPATNKVTATVSLGNSSSHLAVYGGAVWATYQVGFKQAGCENTSEASASVATFDPGCTESEWRVIDQEHLARVDPRTEQVVASGGIGPASKVGFGRLVAGGGYVWFASGGGLARVAP
jgi:DNA-binding beta-propeller fold protein YncE